CRRVTRMTSSLRRKRPTTARPTTAVRTLTSLAVLGWLAAAAHGQSPPAALQPIPTAKDLPPASAAPPPPKTLYFQKDAVPTYPARQQKAGEQRPVAKPLGATAAKPPIIQTRYQPAASGEDSQFKLPPSVERAIDRASKPGEAGLPTNDELFSLRSE